MNMETARLRAADYLVESIPDFDRDFAILDDATMDEGWCWVFFWNSRRYLETRSREDAVAGNAPVVVMKESGGVYLTGTAFPLGHYLDRLRPRSVT
jgi:hypothetical protein